MKILVDKMPTKGKECLFKGHYNILFDYCNCEFHNTTVCALDIGKQCEYLEEKNQCKS